jgi:hypothetical protein
MGNALGDKHQEQDADNYERYVDEGVDSAGSGSQ